MLKVFFKTLFLFFLISTASMAAELKPVSIQLQWKHQFQFAGYYMALEKGFYKEAGLDVNIIEYDNGIDIVKKVMSDEVQFGIGRSSLILNKAQGDDVVLTAAIFQSSPHILIGLKSKIQNIEDIKNKRIMFTGDAFSDTPIISMLSSNGIDIKSLNTIPHSFDAKDLIIGNVDLMSAYISNEPYILKTLGQEASIFDPKDYGFDFYNDILFTSQSYLSKNPQIAEKFVKASLRGWKYAFANIKESVDVIFDKYNTQLKSKAALNYEAKELRKLAYYKTDKIGHIHKEKIDKIYEYYRLLGLIHNPVNLEKIVHEFGNNFSYIEQEFIEDKKVINYCIDPNWMPFESIDKDDKHTGITSDYINLLEKKLQMKFNLIKTQTWQETLAKAKAGECDLLTAMMKTDEREEYLDFTSDYLNIPLVLASRGDVAFINSIEDIIDEKIAITEGYAYVDILRQRYPSLKIVEVKNIDEGLKKVVKGEVYAFAGTLASIGHKFQTKYSGELKIIAKLDDTWDLSMAVKKGDDTLLNIMEKSLKQISEYEKRNIFNKWVSIKYESNIDYKLLSGIFTIFFIIILFFLYKQYLMKKFNKQLQDLLVEKSKAAQMGEMIDAIAHQWKQPLNLISIRNAELKFTSDMDSSLLTNEYITELTDEIHEQIDLLAETTDEFRKFFRQDVKKENVHIYDLIDSVVKLKRDVIRKNKIQVTINESEKIDYDLIVAEFKHVFINLISNAKDAFEEKNIKNKKIDITICKNDLEIEIKVKDNAGGIPVEIIDSVFDAHVTSKEESKGTGIGLYMTYQIVQKLDGVIMVENYEEGEDKGAIFKIKLPLAFVF